MSLAQVKEKQVPPLQGCLPALPSGLHPPLFLSWTKPQAWSSLLSAEKPFVDLPEQKENLLLRKESREQEHRTGQDEAGSKIGAGIVHSLGIHWVFDHCGSRQQSFWVSFHASLHSPEAFFMQNFTPLLKAKNCTQQH